MRRYSLLLLLFLTSLTSMAESRDWFYLPVPNGYGRLSGFSSFAHPWDVNLVANPYFPDNVVSASITFTSEGRENAPFTIGPLSGKTRMPYSDQKIDIYTQNKPDMPAAYSKLNVEFEKNDQYSPYVFSFRGGGDDIIPGGAIPADYPNYFGGWTGGEISSSVENQLRYNSTRYANSKYTIADYGCFLCCVVASLNNIGMWNYTTPACLNEWLEKNKGYLGLKVDPAAVVRWALKTQNVSVGFKRNVPLEEALQRGLQVQCSVKNSGHWVKPTGYKVYKNGTLKTIIGDPAGYRYRFLESYNGANSGNTRCFYKKKAAVKSYTSTSISSLAISDSTLLQAEESTSNYGYSAISIFSMSPVGITLKLKGEVIGTGEGEPLENAQTGELLDAGVSLSIDDAAHGMYEIILSGRPGTAYEVLVRDYNFDCDITEKTYTGNISPEGTSVINHSHITGMETSKISDIISLPDGTSVVLTGGVVTAGENYSLHIQNKASFVPSLNVSLSGYGTNYGKNGGNLLGYEVTNLAGKLGTSNGERYLYSPETVYLKSGSVLPEPVAVNRSKLASTKGVYAKTWGKITAISNVYQMRDCLTLDNQTQVLITCNPGSLPVEYVVGDMITAIGVYSTYDSSKKRFLVGRLSNIERISR